MKRDIVEEVNYVYYFKGRRESFISCRKKEKVWWWKSEGFKMVRMSLFMNSNWYVEIVLRMDLDDKEFRKFGV